MWHSRKHKHCVDRRTRHLNLLSLVSTNYEAMVMYSPLGSDVKASMLSEFHPRTEGDTGIRTGPRASISTAMPSLPWHPRTYHCTSDAWLILVELEWEISRALNKIGKVFLISKNTGGQHVRFIFSTPSWFVLESLLFVPIVPRSVLFEWNGEGGGERGQKLTLSLGFEGLHFRALLQTSLSLLLSIGVKS